MKQLVLIDLDKTLIDKSYRLTVGETEVREAARRCVEARIVLGLCSDSPLSILRKWSERIGFTGPIVFEQGAGLYDPESGEEITVLPKATSWFLRLREEVVRAALRKVPQYGIYIGDNTELVGSNLAIPGSFEHLLLVSGQRRHSFSAHVRRRDAVTGALVIDSDELRKIRVEVEGIARLLTTEPLDVDENLEYGILIIHAERNVKANGVRVLMELHNLSSLVYIGDSWRDYIGDPRVIQCAVGNAQEEYKRRCRFVAHESITKGTLELIELILERQEELFPE